MQEYALPKAYSNFQLIITIKEATVVVSQGRTKRVRTNSPINSLTNNNAKLKQVILQMKEVGLLVALNHPMNQGGAHTHLGIAAAIATKDSPSINHKNRTTTIRILRLREHLVLRQM